MENFVNFSKIQVGDTFVTKNYGEDYHFIKVIRSNGKFGAIPACFASPYNTNVLCTRVPAFSDCSNWSCRVIESFHKMNPAKKRELTEHDEIKKQNIMNKSSKMECGARVPMPQNFIYKDVTNSKKIPVVVKIENGYTIIYVNSETAKCLQYLIDMEILDSDSITINPFIQTF